MSDVDTPLSEDELEALINWCEGGYLATFWKEFDELRAAVRAYGYRLPGGVHERFMAAARASVLARKKP